MSIVDGATLITFVQFLFNGIVIGSTYLLAAMSLTLIFGILDIADFAQGAIYMISAYITYFLTFSFSSNYFLALLVSIVAAGLLSVINGFLVYRPLWERGSNEGTLVAALGLLIITQNIAAYYIGTTIRTVMTPFNDKYVLFGVVLTQHRLFTVAVSLVTVAILWLYLERTMTGRGLRGMAQDSELSQLTGVPTRYVYVITFFIGGMMTGLAGGLISPLRTVDPSMGLNLIIFAFIIVVLGGFGSVKGTFIASYFIAGIEAFTSGYISSEYSTFAAFLVLVVVIMFKPGGLFGGEASV